MQRHPVSITAENAMPYPQGSKGMELARMRVHFTGGSGEFQHVGEGRWIYLCAEVLEMKIHPLEGNWGKESHGEGGEDAVEHCTPGLTG